MQSMQSKPFAYIVGESKFEGSDPSMITQERLEEIKRVAAKFEVMRLDEETLNKMCYNPGCLMSTDEIRKGLEKRG